MPATLGYKPSYLPQYKPSYSGGAPIPPASSVLGATTFAGRAYSAPPGSGTLTTVQPSVWASGQNYTVDPTTGGINKVVDNTDGVSRLYQCRSNHLSAAGNRPVAGVTNTTWLHLGLAPIADTVAGSQLIGISWGRHLGPGGPLPTPTDNDGGTYTLIRRQTYASFPDWAIGVFRRTAATAAPRIGVTASVPWAETTPGSGAGEEAAVGLIELLVPAGAPVVDVHAERASPTAGFVTGATYSLSQTCVVLSVLGPNGGALPAGDLHVVSAPAGFTRLGTIGSVVSYTVNGYFQGAAAVAVLPPGIGYTNRWGCGEGAQMFDLAWPL